MNSELQRTGLINGIVIEIKRRIMFGKYAHDDMLPSQDELASSLGVSRASLREALNQLSLLGLIEAQHGVGTFIKKPNPSNFFDSFSSLVVLNRKSADELLQARSIIEPAVAALAAENRTQEELDQIRMALELMEAEHKTGFIDNYKAKDSKFHFLIAAASHNQILFSVSRAIRELLPSAIDRAFVDSHALVSNAMELHRKIYEALNRKDPVSASSHMTEHLLSVKSLHEEVFK
jgi:GntR family transcriptional repressor for pyruvate dehydrogenase complex